MGGFLSFVKKEALHILRDKRTMLIVLLLPIVQILLFGFAISTEMNNIDFAVVAPNRTETIRQQIERMEANPYFTFKGYISQAEIDDVLRKGDVTAVVVFSEDYDRLVTNAGIEGVSEAAVQFILDASNPNNAGTGLGYLQSSFQSGISVASVAPATRVLYNPQMKSSYNFVPGIMGLIFILICAMMTSVSIVREKETGTMEVLLVSPVRPIWIIFAKMIPYFLLSCVNLVVILVLARYVLGVPMSGSMVGLVGLSLLYLVLSLALGLFISTMANTQVTAMQDYDKAQIIGTQTFGKGIVQTIRPLTDGSAVKYTIAKYFTPKGQDIHGKGVTPDSIVELPDDATEDVQLKAAVEYLNGKMSVSAAE